MGRPKGTKRPTSSVHVLGRGTGHGIALWRLFPRWRRRDSDPNFKNSDLFHAQSPDAGRGVSRPFVASEPECRCEALVSWVL